MKRTAEALSMANLRGVRGGKPFSRYDIRYGRRNWHEIH